MRAMLVAAAAMMVATAAQAAGPNLIINGSFEQNNLTPTSLNGFKAANPGINVVGVEVDGHLGGFGNTVTGWSTDLSAPYGAGYNLYFFDGDTAKTGDAASIYPGEQQRPNANFTGDSPDGSGVGAFMVLDGDPNYTAPFQQLVNGLTVGQAYKLSFYWAGGELSNRTGYNTIKLTGTFGGSAFSTETFNNSKPVGVTGDFSGWGLRSYTFTATSTSQLLRFLAVGTPAANLPPVAFLDGVSLVAVPEPATWAMMLLGLGSLGAMLRSRRRQAA